MLFPHGNAQHSFLLDFYTKGRILLLFIQLYRLIARKGLPQGMTLTMRDHAIIVVPVHAGARPILINVVWDFVRMLPFIKKILQRKLREQIEAFVEWNKKFTGTAYRTHHEVLTDFMHATQFRNAREIKPEHIDEYCKTRRTPLSEIYAKRSLQMFVKYNWRLIIQPENAKLVSMNKRLGGRKPFIEKIKKVKQLRREGVPYSKIAKVMKKNRSLVHRWANYPEEKLIQRELELSTAE